MKYVLAMLALVLAASAQAQTVPDLKGTWIGKGKSLVYGSNEHNPGAPTSETTPRVRELEFTLVVTGQDGRLAWGYSLSSAAATREPFAWAMMSDGKTIVGSDTDGSFHIVLVSADRLEQCYTHTGLSPGKSIVATCKMLDRKK
jgi:hypothetical protein